MTLRPEFVEVGTISDFQIGEFVPRDAEGKEVWILRTPTGKWHAIKNSCPHHGWPVCGTGAARGTWLPSAPDVYQFGLEYEIIRCPHHGFEYDLETGRPALMPEGTSAIRERLVRYEVKVNGDRVLVSRRGH